MSAPGTRVDDTKVATDPMSTQIAEANLNGYIVICAGKVKKLRVSLYRTQGCLLRSLTYSDINLSNSSSCTQSGVTTLSSLRLIELRKLYNYTITV